MLSYRDLLNTLYGGCGCPVPVRIDGVATVTDTPDFADAPGGRIEISADTIDGVTFLVGQTDAVGLDVVTACRLKPSAAICDGNTTFLMWALKAPVPKADATRLAAIAGMLSVESFVPLPPTDGWEIVCTDAECFYTLAEMAAVYGSPELEWDADAVNKISEFYKDAHVIAQYVADDYQQEIVVSSAGRKEATEWDTKRWTIARFIDLLMTHRVGRKNGPAFVLADLASGQRTKNAVKAIYGIGLDIDTGTPSYAIDRALQKSGWLAVRYTTHSHGKIYSEFPKDRIAQFGSGSPISTDLVRKFVLEVEGWDQTVAATVELDGIDHTRRGVMVRLLHAPMPKNRVILFLEKPYVIAEEASTQAEAVRNWARIPAAVAAELGVPLDEACLDPCRMFFYPRHDKDQPYEITLCGGRLVSLNDLDLGPTDPSGGQGPGSKKGGKSTTTEGKGLGRWCVQRGDGFQIVDVLETYAPDRIRGRASANATIECPFDELHSNAGDPDDKACFAINAGDGPAPVFTISCRHESCRDKTNLDMLGKMLKDGWFERDILENEAFDAVIRDETGERAGPPGPQEPMGGLYDNRDKLMADLRPQVSVLLGANQAKLIVEKGERYELLSRSDGMLWFSKYQLETETATGNIKIVPGLSVYLGSAERLEFTGLTNRPGSPRRTPPLYSTWRGLARKPQEGDWSLLKQHVRNVICGGDETAYVWLMSWMAQMLQKPEDKLGTAVVLRGSRGCGKTTLGMALRKIVGHVHSRKVSQQHHVTGHFNAHLQDCLFLLVEEGVWGGNKSAEGVLKDLITGDTAMIEAKFIGAVEMPNYTRVMITSNEKWVVPAGKAERRFLVLDAVDLFEGLPEEDPARKAYFDPLYDEMEQGGYEAMLADLLEWDYTQVNLRQPPMTEGLRKQMAQTFTDEQEWLLGALIQGGFTDRSGNRIPGSNEWDLDKPLEISTNHLLESYRAHVTTYRGSAPSVRGMLQFLRDHGDAAKRRLTAVGGDRPWGHVLGPRRDWRERFSQEYKYVFEDEGEVIDLRAYRAGSDGDRNKPRGPRTAP